MKSHTGIEFSHVGICVHDIEKSKAFYKSILGAEEMFSGAYKGEGISKLVSVRSANYQTALLQLEETKIELISYGVAASSLINHNQVGATHIAFQVRDIDSLYERLLAAGIKPNSPPYMMTEADDVAPVLVGSKFMIFRDPDGLQIEVFQFNEDAGSNSGPASATYAPE